MRVASFWIDRKMFALTQDLTFGATFRKKLMSSSVKTLPDPNSVAQSFAEDFAELIQSTLAGQTKITVALSGGNTPRILYELWASQYADKIDWNRVHFFWADERCVPSDDADSSYGVANELFLSKVGIAPGNVHRGMGESDPDQERGRYENEIYEHVEIDDNAVPQFDLIILGMGTDGHTASIFPHQMQFMTSDRVCEVAIHPKTAQKRITLTGTVLNGAKKVVFLVTGQEKATVLAQVIQKSGDFEQLPASRVSVADTMFYVDQAAAGSL